MKDGNKDKLKGAMADGGWWSLKELSKAIRKSREETKTRIVALIGEGKVEIQGKTKDRRYRLRLKAAAPKIGRAHV